MSLNQLEEDNLKLTEKIAVTISNLISDIKEHIFFIQERRGKVWATFNIYKIRTMQKDAEKNIAEEPINWDKQIGDIRILKYRKWMRKTGVDEIPQIINILKWEMNLFGSRPMDENNYEKLTILQKKRRDNYKPWIFWWYAFSDKWNNAPNRTNRSNEDMYLKFREQSENKWKLASIKFNIYIFIENIKAILRWVNR
jgi:lipopolysaccharide/colanic/teichoic acid biosynthesis glycosyltransferase